MNSENNEIVYAFLVIFFSFFFIGLGFYFGCSTSQDMYRRTLIKYGVGSYSPKTGEFICKDTSTDCS